MALLRTARIAAGAVTQPGNVDGELIYVVPAGYRAVIRHADLANNDVATAEERNFQVWVNTPESTTFYIVYRQVVVGWHSVEWDGHCVLNPGDAMFAACLPLTWGAVWWYQLSGALLPVQSR